MFFGVLTFFAYMIQLSIIFYKDVKMQVYEGNEKYIFVSYAHKDSDRVLPIIEALMARGFRVWYDSGIEVGAEWPEYIGTHLLACECVLAFMSNAAAASENCRNEINLACANKKNLLIAYLEDTELSPGMQLQLGTKQSIYLANQPDMASFIAELCKAQLLLECNEDGVEPPVSKPPKVRKTTAPTKTPADLDRLAKKHKEAEKTQSPKLRVGCFIFLCLSFFLSAFFLVAAMVSGEYSTLSGTAFNLLVGLMFLTLGYTPKASEYVRLFGDSLKLKKGSFVRLSIFLAFVLGLILYIVLPS